MVKSDLINAISAQMNLHIMDAELAVNTVLDAMKASLERGDRIEIRGFGSFGLKERDARNGRNPKNGTPVHVDAKRVVFFMAGKELRERVDVV
ncbi:MAG: integration host factor subunit beta [Magnetococcus sp. YQC-5]